MVYTLLFKRKLGLAPLIALTFLLCTTHSFAMKRTADEELDDPRSHKTNKPSTCERASTPKRPLDMQHARAGHLLDTQQARTRTQMPPKRVHVQQPPPAGTPRPPYNIATQDATHKMQRTRCNAQPVRWRTRKGRTFLRGWLDMDFRPRHIAVVERKSAAVDRPAQGRR